MTNTPTTTEPKTPKVQFSLLTLMLLVTVVGVYFGLFRWVFMSPELFEGYGHIFFWSSMVMFAICFLYSFTLAAISFIVHCSRRVRAMSNTYYLVTGAHKITGRETSLYIPANTEAAALERATVEGINVESILLEQPEFLRWYQFTLKELLIFMLISGLFFGWCGKKVMEARKQREIVEWVWENGGIVTYEGEYIPYPESPGPDYFCNVKRVFFFPKFTGGNYDTTTDSFTDVNELGVTPLYDLPHLRSISFVGLRLSNQELQKLQEALPHCEISFKEFSEQDFITDWCFRCNDFHAEGSNPHTAEP